MGIYKFCSIRFNSTDQFRKFSRFNSTQFINSKKTCPVQLISTHELSWVELNWPFFKWSCPALVCSCLATIDRCFPTCFRVHWQQWCNIKPAQRHIIRVMIFRILHGITYLVFLDHILSSSTNKVSCTNTNYIFVQYLSFVILLVLIGYSPVVIRALFGWMTNRNVQQLAHCTVPLIRRELNKKLATMF